MRVLVVDAGTLMNNWWLVVLRGVAGILFGALTFFVPRLSLIALVLLFGAYAFVDGILAIGSALRRREAGMHWWMMLLEGIAGVAAGVVTAIRPGLTALALLYLIAAWALLTGVLELMAAVRLRRAIRGEWLLVLGGIASFVLGVLLLFFPRAGALAVVLWIGAYALVFGILLVALGVRLRAWGRGRRSAQHTPEIA
jgi:uncharacterized membrane protein HdeD (DUF308 family)